MTAPAGAVNAWQCERCGGVLAAIHVHEGTTPMFLACRAPHSAPAPACQGRMMSSGYPPGPVPDRIRLAIAWEWRLPTSTERKRWRRENPAMLDHVNRGGLVLAPLSPAGRAMIAHTSTNPTHERPQ